MKIIAALPAYNEENFIGSVVLRAKKHVDKVIVVDDGSIDATSEIAELAGAMIIKHEKNMGYGAAIKSCFKVAREMDADVLVILDSDGQHNPDEIPFLLDPVINGKAELVIGSRFIEKQSYDIPMYRKVGMKVLDAATNISSISSKAKVSDSQSGFRAYSKKAINALKFSEKGMGAGSSILLHAQDIGLNIMEVPISCRYDVKNGSTQSPISHGLNVLVSIIKFIGRKHPLTFFGIPGAISFGIGIWLGLWVVDRYNATQAFAIGNALLTVLFTLIGIFSIFTGLVLYTVSSMIQDVLSEK